MGLPKNNSPVPGAPNLPGQANPSGPGNQPGPPANGEICVPLSALAQPDAGDQLQTPEEGDTVTMQVDATVDRIEGDNAYIKPTAINGNPIANPGRKSAASPAADDDGQSSDEADAAEGQALRNEALRMGR